MILRPRSLRRPLLTQVILFGVFISGCLPPGLTTGGVFRDVAEETGLRFRWGHDGRSPLTIRDTAGGGAGFIDYDGDGRLDILLVGERVALYHNEGDGRFRDVTPDSGLTVRGELMGCAVGDFDNDGRPDIFITGYGVARLYRNQGKSGELFRDVTGRAGVGPRRTDDWATSAGFVDLDGDGLLDLAVCHYVEFTPDTRQFCDYQQRSAPGMIQGACPPFFYEPQRLWVYRNRGDGRFEDVTARLPASHGNSLGIAFADYDGDGRIDVYVANDGEPGDLYHNLGGWRFENVGTASGTAYNADGREQAGMGADWGDFDGDGRLDLIVATFQDEPRSLYRNEGNGLFSYASYSAGIGNAGRSHLSFGVAFLDFDNDGRLDLIFTNGHVQDTVAKIRPHATYAQPMLLFRNLGGGTFTDATADVGPALQGGMVGRALAVGDYDNDGRVDVLVADLEGRPRLLHNESRNDHHWLGVRVLSRAGRDALGARITLETATGPQVAEAHTCRSYLAASDPRVHFGLGTVAKVARVTVRWPSGKVTTTALPEIDRYVTIHEEP